MDYFEEMDKAATRNAVVTTWNDKGEATVFLPWIRAHAFMGLTRATEQYADRKIRKINPNFRIQFTSDSNHRSARFPFGYRARHYIIR